MAAEILKANMVVIIIKGKIFQNSFQIKYNETNRIKNVTIYLLIDFNRNKNVTIYLFSFSPRLQSDLFYF